MKERYLIKILNSPNTVLTFKDIMLLWRETNSVNAKSRINYYIKQGLLHPIRKGIYAKNKDYEPYELAIKLFTPSYISLETVLSKEGVIFQSYNKIFLASYKTAQIKVAGRLFSFRKIKNSVLMDPSGINIGDNFSIASKERALLDTMYLNRMYHFDNLSSIDWEKCFNLVKMYGNKNMEKRLNKYRQESDA
ncbi:MAG: hypothetical protein V1647_01035 [Pseudomonadota bacterium]